MSLVEATASPGANLSKLAAQSRRYCRRHGGVVQKRVPTFGTNNPGAIALNGTREFCKFTSATDGSRIFVGLDTLSTRQPTLASLAYLTRPQVGNIPPAVNPAVLQACVFPDQSVIDSFGIFDHSKGFVRGVDLTDVFGYQSDSPPFVFGN